MRALLPLVSVTLVLATQVLAEPSTSTPSPDPILAFFPRAALDRGVSGSVILGCGRTEHGGFTDCKVLRESPSGEGFGDAAMALAAHAVECPTLSLALKKRISVPVDFEFSASTGNIAPNVLRADWPVVGGDWVRRPTGEELASIIPPRALREHQSGMATLICETGATAGVKNCRVAGENPPDYGFGQADLAALPYFHISPSLDCARRPVDATVVIPMTFRIPRS